MIRGISAAVPLQALACRDEFDPAPLTPALAHTSAQTADPRFDLCTTEFYELDSTAPEYCLAIPEVRRQRQRFDFAIAKQVSNGRSSGLPGSASCHWLH